METITTGRPLDEHGDPTDGPALELATDGPAAEMFAASPNPLASSPATDTWSTVIRYPEDDDPKEPAMLVWLGPDATELPAHVHTNGTEYFRTLEGELTVVVDGEPHRLRPGEEMTVECGREHYFRNDTGDYVAFYVEVPWMKTIETQFTAFGMDHDGVFGDAGGYGEPGFVQGLLLGEYISDGTRITVAPFVVQRILWATVGRVAKAFGRRATDERYLDGEFWERTVEQPEL